MIATINLKTLKTLRKHAADTRAAQERAPLLSQARDCSSHRCFSGAFVATSEGGNSLTQLAAYDTYLNCRNKQEVEKAQQKVVRISHIELANLTNKILLVPGKLYILTSLTSSTVW